MSIVNVEALKSQGCELWWPGQYAESGAYDDDGNKRGFLILPDGVTVTPSGTFTTQKMKDGRNIWKFDGSTTNIGLSNNTAFDLGLSSSPFTICVWIKTPSTTTATIFSRGGGYAGWNSTNGHQYLLFIYLSEIYFQCWGGSLISLHASIPNAIGNIWTLLTIVYNGSTIFLYANNVLMGSIAATTLVKPKNSVYTSIGNVVSGGYRIVGNIKDLIIFKGRALTLDQIAAIYKETFIY